MRRAVTILLSGAMVLMFHTSCSPPNASGDDSSFGNDVLAGPEIRERALAPHRINRNDTIPAQVQPKGTPGTNSKRNAGGSDNLLGSNDNIPTKRKAQDFNTTRSNRQNSNYQAGLADGNNRGNAGATAPTPAQAQDFNTTRSNRQNSNYQAGLADGNNGGNAGATAPMPAQAQDFNTTRSNRQNSNYQAGLADGNNRGNAGATAPMPAQAQDFNTTRSNRQNSNYQASLADGNNGGNASTTAPTPAQAQDFNTTRSNRQNSNYRHGLGGGNTNGGIDSAAMATTTRHSKTAQNNIGKKPCNSFSVYSGLVSRSDGHTGAGWLIGGYHETPLGSIRNLRLTVGVTYTSQAFQYQVPKKLPLEFAGELAESIGQGRWNILTVSAGPAFEFGKSRFHADLYARPGISFVAIPDQFVGITETPEKMDDEHGIAKFSGNKTPLSLQTGIHIGYAINGKIDLFLNPNFFATISRNVSYLEKDVSRALRDGKTFDYSTFISLPYERKIERIQVAALSAGVKFHFCR